MKPEFRHEFHLELSAFSRYIRLLIKRTRWTQTEFAKYLGVERSTVLRWINQETLPSLRIRKKMKVLDTALRKQTSKEDEERIQQQEKAREERRLAREKRRRERLAQPKPERQPDQMVSRVRAPVVDEPEEMVNG